MSRGFFGIRGPVSRELGVVLGALPVVFLLFVWWIYTRGDVEARWISPTILPSPGEVLSKLVPLLTDRDLFHHIGASLLRVLESYALALTLVLPLGILMGAFGPFRAAFAPLMTASGYIPIATLVPLTMSWFGTGEAQKIIFLAMAFGVYLLPLVVSAIDAVPDVYLRTAETLGATRLQVVTRVLVPIAGPDLWHAMRLAFGVGWTYLVLAEVVVLVDGLGYLIEIARRRGPRENINLANLVITAIAWVADLLWERLGDRLFPYRKRAR